MRHQRKRGKLGMRQQHRLLTLRNLATSLFLEGKIQTTQARAKNLIPLAQRLVSIARDPDLADFNKYRRIRAFIQDRSAVDRIFEVAEQFPDRKASIVRFFRLGFRRGDAAFLAQVRLITPEELQKPAPPAVKPAEEKKPRRRFFGLPGIRRKDKKKEQNQRSPAP